MWRWQVAKKAVHGGLYLLEYLDMIILVAAMTCLTHFLPLSYWNYYDTFKKEPLFTQDFALESIEDQYGDVQLLDKLME